MGSRERRDGLMRGREGGGGAGRGDAGVVA